MFGAGRTGRLLARKLVLQGFRVAVLVRSLSTETLNLLGSGVSYSYGDMTDYRTLLDAMEDVDRIIFAAEGADQQTELNGMQQVLRAFQDTRTFMYGDAEATKLTLLKMRRDADFNRFRVEDSSEEIKYRLASAGIGADAEPVGDPLADPTLPSGDDGDPFPPLLEAAYRGEATTAANLLAAGVEDCNAANRFGNTALIIAAARGHASVVMMLARDERVDLNAANVNGLTAFSYAVAHWRLAALLVLLGNERANPNAADGDGNTALITAARGGRLRAVQLLLSVDRVDPNVLNHRGKTALTVAAEGGHDDVVLALLADERVQPDSTAAPEGNTPLISASGLGKLPVVALLLGDLRVDVNFAGRHGNTA